MTTRSTMGTLSLLLLAAAAPRGAGLAKADELAGSLDRQLGGGR